MEKKVFCVACDGRLFQNEDECLKYEGVVKAVSKLTNFLNKDGCLFVRMFSYVDMHSSEHYKDIKEEMKVRGLEKLIDSNSEIKEWVNKEPDFQESSPLCKNCEFNCHDKNYGYDFCQLFEEGGNPKEYKHIKSTRFNEELMEISNFCREYKKCEDCPFLKKETNRYGEEFSYCDVVASIFNLYDEIAEYGQDDFDSDYLICLREAY